jgi:hypothetical protein
MGLDVIESGDRGIGADFTSSRFHRHQVSVNPSHDAVGDLRVPIQASSCGCGVD